MICTICKKEIEGTESTCEECKQKWYKNHAREKMVSNPNKKLDADAAEAFKAGLTYGKWRMREDMRKRGEIE